jgi:hypothetical protein
MSPVVNVNGVTRGVRCTGSGSGSSTSNKMDELRSAVQQGSGDQSKMMKPFNESPSQDGGVFEIKLRDDNEDEGVDKPNSFQRNKGSTSGWRMRSYANDANVNGSMISD